MANRDAPRGLRPVGHLNGSPYNGQANLYYIPDSDSTATFVGDLVKIHGSSDSRGVPTVIQSTAGDTHVGVVVGFVADGDDLTLKHRLADTARYVWVADSPDLLFECQEDSDGGALAADDVGNNIEVIVGSGSTVSGLSGMELNSDTADTTNTLSLRIHRLSDREDNEIGTNADWVVSINLHRYRSTTGV